MGNTEQDDTALPAKREVVRASTNVEVVSAEGFARRLQGMSGYVSNQRASSHQRHYGSKNNNSNHDAGNNDSTGKDNKPKKKKKQNRRNKNGGQQPETSGPEVVQPTETRRWTAQPRQRSFDTDSDVSVFSTDDDVVHGIFGDVSSIPEFYPKYMRDAAERMRQDTQQVGMMAEQEQLARQGESANLTALIKTVIQKSSREDSRNLGPNLVGQISDCPKLSGVLNNAVPSPDHSHLQQRSIVESDNVEVICNDLHKTEKNAESMEDTDSVSDRSSVLSDRSSVVSDKSSVVSDKSSVVSDRSSVVSDKSSVVSDKSSVVSDKSSVVSDRSSVVSDKSSVVSSSEACSDSDGQVVEDAAGSEFSREDLERYIHYTTGYPIFRNVCEPCFCSLCLPRWWNPRPMYQGLYPKPARSGRARKRGAGRNKNKQQPDQEVKDKEGGVEETRGDKKKTRANKKRNGNASPTQNNKQNKSCPSLPTDRRGGGGWPRRKSDRQLWDIICQTQRPRGRGVGDNPYPDNVYVDLSGTDMTLAVYYHHQCLQNEMAKDTFNASRRNRNAYSSGNRSRCRGLPYGSMSPLPLSVNYDALPKIAMVPPYELRKFQDVPVPRREWMAVNTTPIPKSASPFTVMSYNVLCDKYCTTKQYEHCPTWALNWEYRKRGILEHILEYGATIIMLQEVETGQFYDFFLPHLQMSGYDGIFSPKSRARTMREEARRSVDGCAIFFKTDSFSLVEKKLVEFNQLAMASAEGSYNMLNRVMTKDNIGLCALLEVNPALLQKRNFSRKTPSRQMFLVSTAHIHWDPQFSDVKMVQTIMLMRELQNFMEEANMKYDLPCRGLNNTNSIPFIFSGDLNSLPESGVVEFLSSGKVSSSHKDFMSNTYEEAIRTMCSDDSTVIRHNFRLARAYGDIMPVTNYTSDFKGAIDHMFYAQDHLRVLRHLGPYPEEWFQQNKVVGCPHPHIPSDHFSLLVEFDLLAKPRTSRG